MNLRHLVVALLVGSLCPAARAMFVRPESVPVERLIRNTEAYIHEHPDDAMGPYTLGRIHYLAFAMGTDQLRSYQPGEPAEKLATIPDMFNPVNGKPGGPEVPEAALRAHLKGAIENYRKAIAMEKQNALFHLGLASVIESALKSGLQLEAIPGDKETEKPKDGDWKPVWREAAIAQYLRAYDLAIEKDLAVKFRPITGLRSLVAYEAGTHYVAMVDARGLRDDEKAQLAAVGKGVDELKAKPMGPITPIILSTERAAGLADLLESGRIVSFDLDGTGRPQRYRWVRPDTGILVWDPAGQGHITSGHQLFGSVTFQIFWSDGYRALDALDDNRDGQLSGAELKGLALWHDRNGNGVSDPGELVPVDQSGIRSISTRKTGYVGDSPANFDGLGMKDGQRLPTYDWTTRAVN